LFKLLGDGIAVTQSLVALGWPVPAHVPHATSPAVCRCQRSGSVTGGG